MSSNQSATNNQSVCATQMKTTIDKFVWNIENFAERKDKCGEHLFSSEFTTTAPNDGQTLKWQLKMYPNGSINFKDYFSIFLYRRDTNEEMVNAKYQISLRKSDGDEFAPKSSTAYVEFGNSRVKNWGFSDLIKKEELLNEENGYLDDGRLTIVCKLMIKQESDVEVPECQIVEDMSRLFEESLFPDCKITSEDNKKFKVHKCILGCRSPVFGAMFQHDMVEKNNNEINIEDMKGAVIEQMLRFIYSGKEPDLLEEMAEDLLIGADKYELPRLKILCERKLINSIAIENACRMLVLANRYSAEHLKAKALNFIKFYGSEVMKTEEWKELADEQLKEQILEAVLAKQI